MFYFIIYEIKYIKFFVRGGSLTFQYGLYPSLFAEGLHRISGLISCASSPSANEGERHKRTRLGVAESNPEMRSASLRLRLRTSVLSLWDI